MVINSFPNIIKVTVVFIVIRVLLHNSVFPLVTFQRIRITNCASSVPSQQPQVVPVSVCLSVCLASQFHDPCLHSALADETVPTKLAVSGPRFYCALLQTAARLPQSTFFKHTCLNNLWVK